MIFLCVFPCAHQPLAQSVTPPMEHPMGAAQAGTQPALAEISCACQVSTTGGDATGDSVLATE